MPPPRSLAHVHQPLRGVITISGGSDGSEPGMLAVTLNASAGIWVPISGSEGVPSASNPNPQGFAGNVFFYGVGPSYQVYRGQRVRFTPVIELVGWTVLGGFETDYATNPTTLGVSASGTNIVNLKIGARTDVGGGNSFYLGYGRALTSAVWYSDLVRFEYRHTF